MYKSNYNSTENQNALKLEVKGYFFIKPQNLNIN